MALEELWVDKYRPRKLDDYVFRDDQLRDQLDTWIKNKNIPNLLFLGAPGTGKSSAANVLIHELEFNDLDILKVNASVTNSIEDVRGRISNFVQFLSFGEFKVVLLEEFDFFSINAQSALRAILEDYSTVARFILTANFGHKVIGAIKSRCQTVSITKLDHVEYTTKLATILINENIDFELEVLDSFADSAYPDLRKAIHLIQQYSSSGKLVLPKVNEEIGDDWKLKMVELFKSGKIQDARRLLCGKITASEIEEVYRWMYDNIKLFGNSKKQDDAIIIIKQALVDHTIVADSEINLSACLIKLSRLTES